LSRARLAAARSIAELVTSVIPRQPDLLASKLSAEDER
jgi:hypothetical protein